MQFNNNKIKRKNPINRNNLFFSEETFNYEIEMGKRYLEQDINQTVILYEVDLSKTKINDIYKESNSANIVFKTPVELNVIYNLEDATLMSYDRANIKGYYQKVGKLEFSVYESTLKEMDCNIKRGDYIGLQVTEDEMLYFTVTDANEINVGNSQTMYGYKPFWRKIQCAYVDPNEFKG